MKELIVFVLLMIYILIAAKITYVFISEDMKNNEPTDLFLDIVFGLFWPIIFVVGKIFKV